MFKLIQFAFDIFTLPLKIIGIPLKIIDFIFKIFGIVFLLIILYFIGILQPYNDFVNQNLPFAKTVFDASRIFGTK
jgi:hypothetical protein